MKYLILNHKENLIASEISIYVDNIRRLPQTNTTVIICPSTPFLPYFAHPSITLGAQDISRFLSGAYTGEVGPLQLASLKVKYVLIGHSERRAYFEENERIFIKKISNALRCGIRPIYCVGETLEEREMQKTYVVIEKALARVMNEFTREDLKNMIIAYEPIWSVGSGKIPNINEIDSVICFIKELMQNYYELDIPVIYGGSVTPACAKSLKEIPSLDGLLIGEASLEIDNVKSLIDILE